MGPVAVRVGSMGSIRYRPTVGYAKDEWYLNIWMEYDDGKKRTHPRCDVVAMDKIPNNKIASYRILEDGLDKSVQAMRVVMILAGEQQ